MVKFIKKGGISMNFRNLTLRNKLIIVAGVLAIISLFLPWVDLGIISASGFQQAGYLFLIAFIYPILCAYKNAPINKIGGLVCGIAAIIASFVYMDSKTEDFFGETINATGSGLYLFLIASILLTVAIFFNKKPQTV